MDGYEANYDQAFLGTANPGRVNLTQVPSAGGALQNAFENGFGYRTTVEKNPAPALLRGNWEETPVSKSFFSPENVQGIQTQIKQTVFQKSGDRRWVIDDQDVDELQIVMRSMYLQYAKNATHNIPGQIQELNNLVVEYCAPKIMTEIEAHFYFLRDISQNYTPMSRSQNLSSAGTKSLPFRQFM